MAHHGYETVKLHQAEMRRLAAQERLARRARGGWRRAVLAWLGRLQPRRPAVPQEANANSAMAAPAILDELHVLAVAERPQRGPNLHPQHHPHPYHGPHGHAVARQDRAEHSIAQTDCSEGGQHGCGTCRAVD